MKKILSLFAGMVFALAVGTAYADDPQPGSMDTGDKMIRDDDLERYNFDPGKGTFNVMPALPEETGSAPGGSGALGPAGKNDTGDKPAPVEKDIKPDMTTPMDKGTELDGY